MKNIINIGLLFLGIFFVFSCEKEVEVQLPEQKDKLVVEGAIEIAEYPYVVLSKNTSYFATVDTNTFQDMFISDALVTVSDGVLIDTLEYDTVLFFPNFRYVGHKIKGKPNTSYDLRIEYKGETYTATTKILTPVNIDSIRYQYVTGSDSLGYFWLYANDIPNEPNYYRVSTMNAKIDLFDLKEIPAWVYPNISVFDDCCADGKLIRAIVSKGKHPLKSESYYQEHPNDWWAYKMGDEAFVRLTRFDHESYIFWRTLEQVTMNSDNPFAAPATIPSNISGNALGVWSGMASSMQRVKITEEIHVYDR